MSFKRDADDNSLLGTLRKRRVDELFAEDIPDDEAFLMSNGRFACTVCNQRPVFDTINMLAIHRSGKKHLASVEYHKARKQEMEELVRKRRHEMFLKDGSTDITMPSTSKGGLLTSSPYDARARRPKLKPYDRKVRLCLDSRTPKATPANALPGYSKRLYEGSGPMMHSHKLRDIFREKSSQGETVVDKPYIGKGQKSTMTIQRERTGSLNAANQETGFGKNLAATVQTSSIPMDCLALLTLPPPPLPPPPPETACVLSQCETGKDTQIGKNKSYKKMVGTETECKKAEKDAKEKRREDYLKLTEAGWKKDRGGDWIKDEDVEFDSDEEVPSIP